MLDGEVDAVDGEQPAVTFRQSAGFEHGGPQAHDRTERDGAASQHLGAQARVGETAKRDILVAHC